MRGDGPDGPDGGDGGESWLAGGGEQRRPTGGRLGQPANGPARIYLSSLSLRHQQPPPGPSHAHPAPSSPSSAELAAHPALGLRAHCTRHARRC
jgi:hypothetical protein